MRKRDVTRFPRIGDWYATRHLIAHYHVRVGEYAKSIDLHGLNLEFYWNFMIVKKEIKKKKKEKLFCLVRYCQSVVQFNIHYVLIKTLIYIDTTWRILKSAGKMIQARVFGTSLCERNVLLGVRKLWSVPLGARGVQWAIPPGNRECIPPDIPEYFKHLHFFTFQKSINPIKIALWTFQNILNVKSFFKTFFKTSVKSESKIFKSLTSFF